MPVCSRIIKLLNLSSSCTSNKHFNIFIDIQIKLRVFDKMSRGDRLSVFHVPLPTSHAIPYFCRDCGMKT